MPADAARGHRGLTLTELLIALSLVSIIALAAAHLELGSRHFFLLDRRRSTLINEGLAALEHVTRMVRYSANPRGGGATLTVRADRPDEYTVRTPTDTSDDRDVTYQFANGQLTYNNGLTVEVLARYVDVNASNFSINGGTVTTTISTTTQGEAATVQSAATTRFLP